IENLENASRIRCRQQLSLCERVRRLHGEGYFRGIGKKLTARGAREVYKRSVGILSAVSMEIKTASSDSRIQCDVPGPSYRQHSEATGRRNAGRYDCAI